jgi:D-arabinose 1-dehydrogenase-like Zn-dependent alcohol dehydrogenase
VIGPDDILIRLNYTGLCSSDIHMMQGDLGLPPLSAFGVRSPGHEGAGVVVKLGANVKNFQLGDRAGIKPIMDTCGSCTHCWDDKETYCKSAVHAGLMVSGKLISLRNKPMDSFRQVHTSNIWFHPPDTHRPFQMGFQTRSPLQ